MNIINDSNFENEVLNYNGKILIDFWAEWCGPCKMMTPVFQSLKKVLIILNSVRLMLTSVPHLQNVSAL